MAVTPDVAQQVRAALAEAEQLEHARIDVHIDEGTIVLTGAVPAAEQAGTAAVVASRYAAVDNRMRIDPHLREDSTADGSLGEPGAQQRRPRTEELSVQASTGEPALVGPDLHHDADSALAENTPLDPPEAPHTAPTPAEQRGLAEEPAGPEPVAGPGAGPDEDAAQSLPGLTQQELERAARRDANGDAHE